jgi:hypothetical protein
MVLEPPLEPVSTPTDLEEDQPAPSPRAAVSTAPKVIKVAQTIVVACDPRLAFSVRWDVAGLRKWQRGIVSAEMESAKPLGLGSAWIERRTGPDESVIEWRVEVVDYQANQRVGLSVHRDQVLVDETHAFEPQDRFTKYTVSWEMTGGTTPAAALQKQLVESMLELKWAIEWPSRNRV